MSELVKINAKDYGLEETKAKEISDMFKPMLDKMVELEKEFNTLAKGEISKELCNEAKTLRRKYVKVRTGTVEIHKELKAFYLQGGRFVDGWKNAQLMASQGIEDKLMLIERHYENLELKRIADLRGKREKELEKFDVDFTPGNLGNLESEVWENYISGVKLNYQAKIDAEKEAERIRIQNEKEYQLQYLRVNETAPLSEFIDNWDGTDFRKIEQAVYDGMLSDARKKKTEYDQKQEQIRKDNLRLQKEAEAKERQRIAEEQKRNEQAEKLRKDNEAKLKKIQDEKDQVAKELEEKRIAEEQLEADQLAQIETDKQKGDKDKMLDLVVELEKIRDYKFESESYQKLQSDLIDLIENWIPKIA